MSQSLLLDCCCCHLCCHTLHLQWRQVVAVTAGCLLLCNLHRSTFAVLLPDLASQLGLKASQAGAVQAAMLAAYLVGQVPAGRLADKYSGTR
jgi:MFS family permease